MGKKIETPSSLHEKIGTTEIMKFLFSLVILGLAAAVVHKSRGQLHYAASWCLTVVCIPKPSLYTSLFPQNCLNGLLIITMIVTCIHSLRSLWNTMLRTR